MNGIFEKYNYFFFCLGYFWYDLCDVISNRRGSDLFEIVLHHIIVSFCSHIWSFDMVKNSFENVMRKEIENWKNQS